MIELHQFRPSFGLPNGSAFCMKIEAWLKLKALEYKTVTLDNPGKAPKGKAPYIVHEGKTIADSWLILQYLTQQFGPLTEEKLKPEIAAANYAAARMLEEHLYFILLSERWIIKENADILRDAYFGHINRFIRGPIFSVIVKHMKKQLYQQGMGRHTRQEQMQMGEQAIHSLAGVLDNRAFFDGTAPGETDCITVSYLANILYFTGSSPMNEHVKSEQKLVDYTKRMMQKTFPEHFTRLESGLT